MKQERDAGENIGIMKSKRIILFKLCAALLLGMFLFVLVGLAFYLWGSYEVGKRLDYGYDTTTNPRLVQLEIGDKVFAIPQNHIWSRDRWKGGKVSGVNMHVHCFRILNPTQKPIEMSSIRQEYIERYL